MREFSVHFGKSLNRNNKLTEITVIKEINEYYNRTSLTDTDKRMLQCLLTKLDDIYLQKAEGAFIRSRAKWIEEGEKSTAYFCRLEKRRQERLSIKALLINGNVVTDRSLIAKEAVSFYTKLYSSTFSSDNAESFFSHIKDLIPRIDDEYAL